MDGAGFGFCESARLDDLLDLFDGERDHCGGMVGAFKEQRCDLVDAFVGALGGEQDGDQERVGVLMLEWDIDGGIEFL